MASVREETLRGIKWGVVQKCTMQPVQFLYGVILARLISPDEMGILGLTAIFFAFAGQLQQCGFGTALIRKQDRTDEDICTVFWFNVAMSFVFSLALFLPGTPGGQILSRHRRNHGTVLYTGTITLMMELSKQKTSTHLQELVDSQATPHSVALEYGVLASPKNATHFPNLILQ